MPKDFCYNRTNEGARPAEYCVFPRRRGRVSLRRTTLLYYTKRLNNLAEQFAFEVAMRKLKAKCSKKPSLTLVRGKQWKKKKMAYLLLADESYKNELFKL